MTLYILKSIGLYIMVVILGWMAYQVITTVGGFWPTAVMLFLITLTAVVARMAVKQMKKELDEDRR